MKNFHLLPEDDYYIELESMLGKALTPQDLYQAIVNTPFVNKHKMTLLDLGIIVLLIVNRETNTIDRIALSNTDLAKETVNISAKPFSEIKIPRDNKENAIALAIKEKAPIKVHDWKYLFTPSLTAEEARFNQAGGGIGCSVVFPFSYKDGAALIFSYFQIPDKIKRKHFNFMKHYSSIVENKLNQLK
ncbi:MAG: hypothetical protein NVSMB46_05910 [Candidatus Saccharimonadales bacterium]